MRENARITAVLGPTNTGKTHYAIERMLGHRTGVIGLPLRLLAREVYDRIVAQRGPSVVALVTGEERIVPERTQYWVCTVEAMPQEIGADFIAIDEIQLCADLDRGHVFTDRLLRARGLQETMFLGSDTMRPAIAALVPGVQFVSRPRLSELTYSGSKKISRMPERSAIVGFSVENVYAIAELIRRTKGGCAVVMGALSPRTRNAQVALYQNGDVDYLVATDAIGMGLNLDIRHIAFSSVAKFDGRRMRSLFPQELAQIAGRAGRYMTPGTFGVTGEARPLDDETISAIEDHRFAPVQKLSWRNEIPDYGTVDRLIAALEKHTGNEWLTRARDADDISALKNLAAMPEIRDALRGPAEVRVLGDSCRIPDFRGISSAEHAGLLARIFDFLKSGGRVPDDWLKTKISRIDRTDGDIDAISKRLAFIRTWTYVAQRKGWVSDESHWREETRAVEDRLSDALHARLTQRFVDRRTSVLMRRLKQKESLVAEVNDKGEVRVEGEFVGRMEGFRFRQDGTSSPDEAKTLRQAAYEALKPEFSLRSDRFYNAPDTEFDYTEQGGLMWMTTAVGKLVKGPDAMRPQVEPFVDEEAGPEVAEKVRRRLQHFVDRKVAALFEPLHAIARDEALTGLARGFAFRMVEAMGVLPRDGIAEEVKSLDQEARSALRKHGLRFGQYTIFLPLLLKPAATRLRLVLWSLFEGLQEFPESPPPGLVTIPNLPDVPRRHYTLAGYHPAGTRAIRIDMLERLADLLRAKDSRAGFEATPDMLSITGMTLEQFADLMTGLGYRGDKGERPKAKPVAETAPTPAAVPATDAPPTDASAVSAEHATAQADADATSEPAILSVPEPAAETPADPASESVADATADATSVPSHDSAPQPATESAPESAAPVETEVFYSFVWAPRPRGGERRGNDRSGERRNDRGGDAAKPRRQGGRGPDRTKTDAPADATPTPAVEGGSPAEARPDRKDRQNNRRGDAPGGKPDRGDRKPGGERQGGDRGDRKGGDRPGGPKGKGNDRRPADAQRYEARPPRETKVDPDSPFAILAKLRDKT